MSAKDIAKSYLKQVKFVTHIEARSDGFYFTSMEGESLALHKTSIQRVRHNLTNYSEICRLLIDIEKEKHTDVYLNNILSKFRELVNDLIFRKCLNSVTEFINDYFSDRSSQSR